jgi:hypothetical protein
MKSQTAIRSGFTGGNPLYRRLSQYGIAAATLLLLTHFVLLYCLAPLGPASGVFALLRVSWPKEYGVNALIAQGAPAALLLLALIYEIRVAKSRDFAAQ